MNKIKHFGFLFLAAASLFASCTKPAGGGEEIEGKLELSADRKEITADGTDKTVFTVTYNGADVTAEARIIEVESNQPVTDHTFTTEEAGTYKFKATYDGKESNETTVTATAVSVGLILSSDKDRLISNGEDQVTFTVTYNGTDVTSSSTIVNINAGKPFPEGETTFSTNVSGVYEFKAGYDGMTSNIVKITAAPVAVNPLVLTSNTPRIAANGSDKAVFTVLYNNEDVTSEAKIKDLSTDQYLDTNEFSYSGTLPTVDFVAEYDGQTSNMINIGFGNFYKNVLMFRFTATWCGPCTQLGNVLEQVVKDYPDRLTQVAIHADDEYTSRSYQSFLNYFPGSAVPRVYLDFNSKEIPISLSASEMVSLLKSQTDKGAGCGISITSVVEDRTAKVSIGVTAQTAGTYYIGVILVEDGLVGPQNGVTSYVHNNTLRTLATPIGGDPLGELAVNQQVMEEYSFNLKGFTDNCRVVVYVNTLDGGVYTTTNVASGPISGITDYRFEE